MFQKYSFQIYIALWVICFHSDTIENVTRTEDAKLLKQWYKVVQTNFFSAVNSLFFSQADKNKHPRLQSFSQIYSISYDISYSKYISITETHVSDGNPNTRTIPASLSHLSSHAYAKRFRLGCQATVNVGESQVIWCNFSPTTSVQQMLNTHQNN